MTANNSNSAAAVSHGTVQLDESRLCGFLKGNRNLTAAAGHASSPDQRPSHIALTYMTDLPVVAPHPRDVAGEGREVGAGEHLGAGADDLLDHADVVLVEARQPDLFVEVGQQVQLEVLLQCPPTQCILGLSVAAEPVLMLCQTTTVASGA